jgi:hypothetical protein
MLVPVNAGAFLFALCTEANNDRVRRALLRRLPRAEPAPRAALIERQWDLS